MWQLLFLVKFFDMKKVDVFIMHTMVLLMLLSIPTFSYAQSRKKLKVQERAAKKKADEMAAALKNRYDYEKYYANTSRYQFNFTSWVGRPVAELIESWGPATKTADDGGKGLIYIYEQVTTSSGGSYTPGYIVTENQYGKWVEVERQNAIDTRYTTTTYSYHDIYVDENKIITIVKRR